MSGITTNPYHTNIFEHEFAQTFEADAYDFVDHKVLMFAQSDVDADIEDDFEFSVTDEYDEYMLA